MRIMIIFDLPTQTKKDRRSVYDFRKLLLDSGFKMLQYSIYVRVCNGMANVEKQKQRIRSSLPSKGSIRMMVLTNKQFESMETLVGKLSDQEKTVSNEQLILL